MDSIYRWNGRYFGFVRGDCLFSSGGEYLGWIDDDGQVWRADGRYLGEIADQSYVLRRTSMVRPVNRVPRVHPVRPVRPVPSVNRVGRVSRAGWEDALEEFDVD